MTRKLLGVAAAMAVALIALGSFDDAQARGRGGHGGGGWGGGGMKFSGGGMKWGGGGMKWSGGPKLYAGSFRHSHHRHIPRAFVGVPLAYGAYYYGGGGCYWLKQKAAYTGSPYWWNRYYACVNGYNY